MSDFKYLLVVKMPYNQEQIYNIISAIELYQDYIKWVDNISVLEQEGNKKIARVDVGFLNIKKSFITEDYFMPNSQVIINHVSGPFNYLTGSWEISKIDKNSSQVSFYIEFDIKNKLLGSMLKGVFKKSFSEIVSCFYNRAVYLHGYGDFEMEVIKEQSQG